MDDQHLRAADDTQQAVAMLVAELAENPLRMLQHLPDVARQLCRADDVRAVDLRDIVRNTLESRRPEVERRRQRVTVDVAGDPVLVSGDPVRLVQVLSNLVDNAVKYTPEAGHITVAVTADGNEATVAVQDDGDGIPPDRVASIFDPFVQLSHSRRDARGGLGLGLALVRRLTELHGGRVDVSSAGEGRGSRFAVHLPMHVAPN